MIVWLEKIVLNKKVMKCVVYEMDVIVIKCCREKFVNQFNYLLQMQEEFVMV